ncbi:hypothetical protein HYH02_005385 [Chlamydomonas schloesseri]|uniref:Uncharacterized protein n=1 Tax=Chlamydomonas schloesseri TaxID=2026947 RepID=A0A835WLK8_9CHLO|nr:hypothetical protein HYH02_005385 [Chlamydomonas schloesseri]|eukprot:KAG2449862.1 hypothetical protein HYH02_005385 [Chlamydomonas schloesseri]
MYWGHKTALTFACWVFFAVCFIQGCIWLPISGVALGGCKYCRDQFQGKGRTNLTSVASDLTYAYGLDIGCIASAFKFDLYYPQEASGSNAPHHYYSWCVNSGPVAGLIGGGVVLAAALAVLPVFFFASPPQPKKHQVSFIGPSDLSPEAYAEAFQTTNAAQRQQQMKSAAPTSISTANNNSTKNGNGSQLGVLAAVGASYYASPASSPASARTVASPQLLLSPRVTLSPAGSAPSPRSPGAGAGYVTYSNSAAVYPVNSVGGAGAPGAVPVYGTAPMQPGNGDGGAATAELQHQQRQQQLQAQLQQQDLLEQMAAQQRQQQAALMKLVTGTQGMNAHPHLGGRAHG